MAFLIAVCAFITITTLALAFLSWFRPAQSPATRRLERITSQSPVTFQEMELSKPFAVRVFKPLEEILLRFMQKYTPRQTLDRTRQKLFLAGRPMGMEAAHFVAVKLLLVLTMLFITALGQLPPSRKLVFGAVAALIAYLLPESMLSSRIKQRQKEIQKSLPDVLDLLTVSVEAGLGFDSAVAKVVAKSKGPLAEEFARMLQEIRMGKPRPTALRDLSERVGLDDLSSFVAALVQADQLGVSIGKVLRIQAAEMRRKRRQRAEEAAMKAPIKILIPMVVFIFPTIFVILLGPALIRVLNIFAKR